MPLSFDQTKALILIFIPVSLKPVLNAIAAIFSINQIVKSDIFDNMSLGNK